MADACSPSRVRIITMNTAKADPPYDRRVDLLAAGLGALQPDLVLLQEAFAVPGAGGDSTAGRLAAALGLHCTYAPARAKIRPIEGQAVLCESGMAVLSSVAPLAAEPVWLPTDPEDGERVAQVCRFRYGATDVVLANVHLTYLPGADVLRRAEFCALLERLPASASAQVTIVGGDFNTPLGGMPVLTGGAFGWEFSDCYVLGGGSPQRATVPAARPAGDGRCIDYLLAATAPGGRPPTVTDARVVLGEPDADGVLPSDHRGVMVTLRLGDVQQ